MAAVLFFIASLTDFFDGFIARKLKVESSFGRFLDPIADKVLVTSALIMLIALDRVDAWIVMLIISREVAVSALRATTKSWDSTLKPSRIGKWKAFFQFAAVIPLMIHYDYHFIVDIDFNEIGTVLLVHSSCAHLVVRRGLFIRFYKGYG